MSYRRCRVTRHPQIRSMTGPTCSITSRIRRCTWATPKGYPLAPSRKWTRLVTFSEVDQTGPEQNMADYVNQNGPIDSTPPVVAITSPKANANEGLTLPLRVTVNATDNVAVGSVSVSFDVNGNGTIDPGELVVA